MRLCVRPPQARKTARLSNTCLACVMDFICHFVAYTKCTLTHMPKHTHAFARSHPNEMITERVSLSLSSITKTNSRIICSAGDRPPVLEMEMENPRITFERLSAADRKMFMHKTCQLFLVRLVFYTTRIIISYKRIDYKPPSVAHSSSFSSSPRSPRPSAACAGTTSYKHCVFLPRSARSSHRYLISGVRSWCL